MPVPVPPTPLEHTMPAHRATRHTPRILITFMALVGTAATLLVAAPASATTPGDNGRIAFRRFLNPERTSGAVFTIRPDGRGEIQVTHPPEGFVDRNPDVSPDGTRIVFERQGVACDPACNTREIWVVDADGGHARALTPTPPGTDCDGTVCDHSPAWSPDGRFVAFGRDAGPFGADGLVERLALYIMRADGTGIRRLTQKTLPATGEDIEPQFSP